VSVQDLAYHLEEAGALLLDVREMVEREHDGYIPNSIHSPRGTWRGWRRTRPTTVRHC
jgi:hypothetical protein